MEKSNLHIHLLNHEDGGCEMTTHTTGQDSGNGTSTKYFPDYETDSGSSRSTHPMITRSKDGILKPNPRYKLQVKVADHTGSTSFLLFDREVIQLIHKSAYELLEQQVQEGVLLQAASFQFDEKASISPPIEKIQKYLRQHWKGRQFDFPCIQHIENFGGAYLVQPLKKKQMCLK
ncbi:hypothetical protein Bca4012_006191 [Brassica carinata]